MRADTAVVRGTHKHAVTALRALQPLFGEHRHALSDGETLFLCALRERIEGGAWLTQAEEARVSAIRGEIARRYHAQGA